MAGHFKSEDRNILTEIAEKIQKMKYPKDIRIAVDIDPLNIM